MFVRFVRSVNIRDTDAREGFFCAAYELREDTQLDQYTSERLEILLEWFRENLNIPDKFSRSGSKGSEDRNTKGLSWFKSDAVEVIRKAFELCSLLQENGRYIEILKTDRPGYILYEDAEQIVAEPFADTPR